MLWTLILVLLVFWLLGLIGSVGSGFIHLVLVVAALLLIVQLLSGNKPTH